MTDLVVCLSTGKGTWLAAKRVIDGEDWSNIYIVTNDFGRENFQSSKEVSFIVIDTKNGSVKDNSKTISEALKERVKDTEVAVNIESGTGKEHTAILAAIIRSGLGFRLVTFEDKLEVF